MSQVLKTAFLVLLLSMRGFADSNQKDETEPEEEVPEEMSLRSELLRPKMREVSFSYHLEILLTFHENRQKNYHAKLQDDY